jgi:hypothetical protein
MSNKKNKQLDKFLKIILTSKNKRHEQYLAKKRAKYRAKKKNL